MLPHITGRPANVFDDEAGQKIITSMGDLMSTRLNPTDVALGPVTGGQSPTKAGAQNNEQPAIKTDFLAFKSFDECWSFLDTAEGQCLNFAPSTPQAVQPRAAE